MKKSLLLIFGFIVLISFASIGVALADDAQTPMEDQELTGQQSNPEDDELMKIIQSEGSDQDLPEDLNRSQDIPETEDKPMSQDDSLDLPEGTEPISLDLSGKE